MGMNRCYEEEQDDEFDEDGFDKNGNVYLDGGTLDPPQDEGDYDRKHDPADHVFHKESTGDNCRVCGQKIDKHDLHFACE